jgi:NAD(P)-dependent dehydrogenase (short-subunit alcohol dehydrogenase family)
MKLDFDGQTALVTGATRGIGRQLASDFASLGARVLLTGTDQQAAIRSANALPGKGHLGLGVDFSDADSTRSFLTAVELEPRIDVLVNNAGINRINPVEAVLDEDWLAVQRVNLEAPVRLTRTVSRIMKANGYGRIVNISSIFGVISKEKRALYSMTKFGLRGLTVASAHDLARYGVLVNSVSPGFVKTELTDKMLSPSEQESLTDQIPLRRFAKPDDISPVVVFLASSLNTYVTAQNVVVDGGFISG